VLVLDPSLITSLVAGSFCFGRGEKTVCGVWPWGARVSQPPSSAETFTHNPRAPPSYISYISWSIRHAPIHAPTPSSTPLTSYLRGFVLNPARPVACQPRHTLGEGQSILDTCCHHRCYARQPSGHFVKWSIPADSRHHHFGLPSYARSQRSEDRTTAEYGYCANPLPVERVPFPPPCVG
jgi:hypothetical protein